MENNLIDGRKIAVQRRHTLKLTIAERLAKGIPVPGLVAIRVGDDPASAIYVQHKIKACHDAGFHSDVIHCNASISEIELINLIHQTNEDPAINGLLVQLPLPAHINQEKIIEQIAVQKDVDGFHPYHLGRLLRKHPILRPCTPFGIMNMLAEINYSVEGKHVVIIGVSNIVGRPMGLEILLAGGTPTLCHRLTENLETHVQMADVLITAMGQPGVIRTDWLKPGVVVIDVGITRLPSGQLRGDIDFETAREKAALITPVPGGVGPMTVTTLLENTLTAQQWQRGEIVV